MDHFLAEEGVLDTGENQVDGTVRVKYVPGNTKVIGKCHLPGCLTSVLRLHCVLDVSAVVDTPEYPLLDVVCDGTLLW